MNQVPIQPDVYTWEAYDRAGHLMLSEVTHQGVELAKLMEQPGYIGTFKLVPRALFLPMPPTYETRVPVDQRLVFARRRGFTYDPNTGVHSNPSTVLLIGHAPPDAIEGDERWAVQYVSHDGRLLKGEPG